MSEIAIAAENLSKSYKIMVGKIHHDKLSEMLSSGLRRLLPNKWQNGRQDLQPEIIWALKDASFEIKKNEIVGIIGRNGAGKSTLLKILSRIIQPTSGRAKINGRVGSLLEVGTGFHPELTGRDNIYLSGNILGMRKAEVDQKFDEIVAFAEIERFLDTPVKRYSSGMSMRLAFAVAAHLEPEILIVDEVLAVGDAAFQKKCIGKMGNMTAQGRTVLFVSHSLPAIQALCPRCILLEGGHIVLDGKTRTVLDKYLKLVGHDDLDQEAVVQLWSHPYRLPKMKPALKRMWMTDEEDLVTATVPMGSDVTFHVEYETEFQVQQPIVGLTFETLSGSPVCGTNNLFGAGAKITNAPPTGVLSFRVPRLPLLPGEYMVTVAFATWINENYDKVERAFKLSVLPADVYGTGIVPEIGNCILDGQWNFSSIVPFESHAGGGVPSGGR